MLNWHLWASLKCEKQNCRSVSVHEDTWSFPSSLSVTPSQHNVDSARGIRRSESDTCLSKRGRRHYRQQGRAAKQWEPADSREVWNTSESRPLSLTQQPALLMKQSSICWLWSSTIIIIRNSQLLHPRTSSLLFRRRFESNRGVNKVKSKEDNFPLWACGHDSHWHS